VVPPQLSTEVGHIEQNAENANSSASATGNQVSLNIYGVVPPFSPQQPRADEGQSVNKPIPNLALGFSRVGINREGEIIRFREGGPVCLVVSVTNSPAAQGEFARNATSVFCTLTFTEPMGRRTIVSRACWLDRESSEIPIDIGRVENIIIGFPAQDDWATFHNPNNLSADQVDWNHMWSELEVRTANWGIGASLAVDLKIVSTGVASRGQTFAHRRFQLSRNGDRYGARWLE
jgi:hypothetical protein